MFSVDLMLPSHPLITLSQPLVGIVKTLQVIGDGGGTVWSPPLAAIRPIGRIKKGGQRHQRLHLFCHCPSIHSHKRVSKVCISFVAKTVWLSVGQTAITVCNQFFYPSHFLLRTSNSTRLATEGEIDSQPAWGRNWRGLQALSPSTPAPLWQVSVPHIRTREPPH